MGISARCGNATERRRMREEERKKGPHKIQNRMLQLQKSTNKGIWSGATSAQSYAYTTKCKENRPTCDYCSHRDLKCEWPDIQITQVGAMIRRPALAAPSVPISVNPQLAQPVFTLQDFRLFNNFIQSAYPS